MYPHEIRLRGPWQFRALSEGSARTGILAVPGFWHHQGLDYWGAVELSRSFNWVAKLAEDDVVWLVLDKVIGAARITLNGQQLGCHDFPWDKFRFDVTHLLSSRNQLNIELNAPMGLGQDPRLGLLGCCAEDPAGEHRPPLGGILGGVQLAIESRKILVGPVAFRTGWGPVGGSLDLTADWSSVEPEKDYQVTLRLDERELVRSPLRPGSPLRLSLRGIDAEAWWPKNLGAPTLSTMILDVRSDSETLFEKSWKIGFRTLRLDGSKIWCNGRLVTEDWQQDATLLYADESYRDYFGEDPSKPFEHWRLAQLPIVEVCGHVPPESLLKLCGRAGLVAVCDIGFLPTAESVERRAIDDWLDGHCSVLTLPAKECHTPPEGHQE